MRSLSPSVENGGDVMCDSVPRITSHLGEFDTMIEVSQGKYKGVSVGAVCAYVTEM